MRALVQRVQSAHVEVDGEVVGAIGGGLCAFVGVTHTDDAAVAAKLAEKLWNLRVFDDESRLMNTSAAATDAEVLVVSQFTLYGDTTRGRRPSWSQAAAPEVAEPLIEEVVAQLRRLGATVATGRFRAHMVVHLANDGPVTVMLEA